MKNVMARAWEIAREGQVKFGGKVSEYLSAALKLAWTESKKVKLTTSAGSKKHKSWVAKIVGTDEKYGLKRQFVECVESNVMEKYFELSAGYYEVCDAGERRFIVVKSGEINDVSKYAVTEATA